MESSRLMMPSMKTGGAHNISKIKKISCKAYKKYKKNEAAA
jgi:hypothetical protein